ncbi:PAS domain-containing protein [uncultured Cohaesibacter sp.]|uniref:PAS domain-containing protein n=1 Tax=uncultured Cohaesibacter sp. TaxID=1002546 RepID=UPI0029C68009|nr:PAS domain-containing protein [uncultured Cohaesibacter sp.]
MAETITPTGRERRFQDSEILVSKTDTRGRITYCNKQFRDIAGYSNKELISQPHSLVRHPEMPRTVFKILWGAIEAKREVFAYVKNLCSNGDHYWVFAHVTPTYNGQGEVIGYHSSRRSPNFTAIETIIDPLYRQLCSTENQHTNRKQGLEAGYAQLNDLLKEKAVTYDQFVLSF